MSKYKELDARVFKWLKRNRTGVTTLRIFKALRITDLTVQRHISRRFSQLEDRGVLVCTLQRTLRVCTVVKDPPKTLAKKKWRHPAPPAPPAPSPSIPAANSHEFEQAGGIIQRLETKWGTRPPRTPLGRVTFLEMLHDLE